MYVPYCLDEIWDITVLCPSARLQHPRRRSPPCATTPSPPLTGADHHLPMPSQLCFPGPTSAILRNPRGWLLTGRPGGCGSVCRVAAAAGGDGAAVWQVALSPGARLPHRLLPVLSLPLGARAEVYSSARSESAPPSGGEGGLGHAQTVPAKGPFPPIAHIDVLTTGFYDWSSGKLAIPVHALFLYMHDKTEFWLINHIYIKLARWHTNICRNCPHFDPWYLSYYSGNCSY
jgi:hypothetical protein